MPRNIHSWLFLSVTIVVPEPQTHKTCELVDPFTQWLGNIFHCIWCWFSLVFFGETHGFKFQIQDFELIDTLTWFKDPKADRRSNFSHCNQNQESTLMSGHLTLPSSPIRRLFPGHWSAGKKTVSSKIQFAKRVRDDRVEKTREM